MGRVSDAKERLMEAVKGLIWEGSYGSTTIDDICEKAQVRKGSFYHFFKSKSDLVIAALESHFEAARVEFDRIFSPSLPPVERLRGFFDYMLRRQTEKKAQAGRVLGCPYGSAGNSCCSEEQLIREKVGMIFTTYMKYFETALRDGKADGSIPVKDIPATVETVFELIEGAMSSARLKNSLKPIENMGRGAFMLLQLDWEPKTAGTKG